MIVKVISAIVIISEHITDLYVTEFPLLTYFGKISFNQEFIVDVLAWLKEKIIYIQVNSVNICYFCGSCKSKPC